MTCQTRSKRETLLRYFDGDPSKINVCEGYDLISHSDDNMDGDPSKITICGGYDLICHSDGNKPGGGTDCIVRMTFNHYNTVLNVYRA